MPGIGRFVWVLSLALVSGQIISWQPIIRIKEGTQHEPVAEVDLKVVLSGPGALHVALGRQTEMWIHLFTHTRKISIPVICGGDYQLNLYTIEMPNATYSLRGSFPFHVNCHQSAKNPDILLDIFCGLTFFLTLGWFSFICYYCCCHRRLRASISSSSFFDDDTRSSASYLESRTCRRSRPIDLPPLPSERCRPFPPRFDDLPSLPSERRGPLPPRYEAGPPPPHVYVAVREPRPGPSREEVPVDNQSEEEEAPRSLQCPDEMFVFENEDFSASEVRNE